VVLGTAATTAAAAMNLHHMHQVGPKAARNSSLYSKNFNIFKPFSNNKSVSRRQLTVVAGEARSANRTKWSRRDAEQQLTQNADDLNVTINNLPIQQLADVDPHELVSSMLQQQHPQQQLLLQSDRVPAASLLVTSAQLWALAAIHASQQCMHANDVKRALASRSAH
jgi:hypothetical protein